MGLFGFGKKDKPKKECALCGGKVGFFGYKLAGGQILCSDCRSQCTPGSNLDFNSMTPEDVKENIAIASANLEKGASEFNSTREFYTGSNHDRPVLFADEDHGWFMNAAKDDGWVYNLDDITYYNMRISTSDLDDEEKGGFLDWLFAPDFYSAYPELPQCPYNKKIIGAYLTLRLLENELGIDEVEIDVFPGLFTDEEDVRAAYRCCHEFYEFMDEYHRNARQDTRSTAAPVPSESENLDAIKKLHDLLEAGILTQEEFDAKKRQLLGL